MHKTEDAILGSVLEGLIVKNNRGSYTRVIESFTVTTCVREEKFWIRVLANAIEPWDFKQNQKMRAAIGFDICFLNVGYEEHLCSYNLGDPELREKVRAKAKEIIDYLKSGQYKEKTNDDTPI